MAAALLRRALHLRRALPSPSRAGALLPAASSPAHRVLSGFTTTASPTNTQQNSSSTTTIDLSSGESRRRLINRLVYRSKQRGFLELDLVLGSWVEQHIHSMDEANIRALLQVLDLENPDLWKWLTGQEQPPEAVNSNPVFVAVKSNVTDNLSKHSSPETRSALAFLTPKTCNLLGEFDHQLAPKCQPYPLITIHKSPMGGRMLSSPEPTLSTMAMSAAHGEDSPYFAGWRAYDEDPYDTITNPQGVIQMGLAENQVSFDLLEEYMREHPEVSDCGAGFRENALFQDYHGLKSFRKAMVSFMETIRGGKASFDPDRIVLTAGATAANELLTFILADPGDALLVPTPYYPGFDRDLRWRTGVNIVPVSCDSAAGFQVTAGALQAAYDEAAAAGTRVRGVLITNPSNPLGTTVERGVLEDVLDFVARNDLHLISDEIYSGSVFAAPDLVSVSELVDGAAANIARRVHIVYSLSKDLGLPGFRVGVVYSYNDAVVAAARRMSSFTLVSSQTQRALAAMLSDAAFAAAYVRSNRDRLRERHGHVVSGLRRAGVACLRGANAGLFVWVDMRRLLDEATVAGELRLWRRVIAEARLNISPGSSCHCHEPGWFRVCFANMSLETLDVALHRVSCFIKKWDKTMQEQEN